MKLSENFLRKILYHCYSHSLVLFENTYSVIYDFLKLLPHPEKDSLVFFCLLHDI